MKPSFTLSYGLGWSLEMPPSEAQGKQIVLVGPDNKPSAPQNYLNAREQAALAGQVYNPEVGFSLVDNVAGHPKYPYNPFYKSFSPRIAAAWNPSFDDGLLGSVFGQKQDGRPRRLQHPLRPLERCGPGAGTAAGHRPYPSGSVRQPAEQMAPAADLAVRLQILPSASVLRPAASMVWWRPLHGPPRPCPSQTIPDLTPLPLVPDEGLDPNFRPSMSQQFDFTVQRQINSRLTVEVGYIGRLLTHEFQPINMNAVPYMMTLGGQRFDKAYGQMVWQYCGGNQGMAGGNCAGNLSAVTPQPFFEAALNKAYCAGFASCTQAVAAKEGNDNGTGNIGLANVWSIWSDLDDGAVQLPPIDAEHTDRRPRTVSGRAGSCRPTLPRTPASVPETTMPCS